MTTPVLTLSRLKRWHACDGGYARVAERYPEGVPLTTSVVRELDAQGADVIWAACHLLRSPERQAFVLFTLRQRQPALVARLHEAGLPEYARAVEGLSFRTHHAAMRARPHLHEARLPAELSHSLFSALNRAHRFAGIFKPDWQDAMNASYDAIAAMPTREEQERARAAHVSWFLGELGKRGVVVVG